MATHDRFLTMSKRFLQAATDLSSQGGEGWRFPVPHYLAGHAIELALKAHLVHGGANDAQLRGLGHDLEATYKAADAGIRSLLTNPQRDALLELSPYYGGKRLEYPFGHVRQITSYPSVTPLLRAAERLVGHLDGLFRDEVRKKLRAKGK